MNRGSAWIAAVFTLVAVISGCKKYTPPELLAPKAPEGLAATLTIAEYKERYAGTAKATPVEIDVDYVLKAVVGGNDKSGNIYKQIYVQDGTGGISIGCDQDGIANDYAEGQEVYIRLLGLAAVSYGGQLQIGHLKTNANRIPYEVFKEHVLRNGWAEKGKPAPRVVTLSELSDDMLGTVVKFEGVHFADGGRLPFAEHEQTVNRQLIDGQGHTLTVRNSGYANFSADILPTGVGSVTGILSKHNSSYQLFLRSREDVGPFDGKGVSPSIVPTPGGSELKGVEVLSETFKTGLGAFTPVNVSGLQQWGFREYNGRGYASMSGYQSGASHANEDWLISPAVDLGDAKAAVLTFRHTWNKGDVSRMKQELQVMFSYDYAGGEPGTATWLPAPIPTYPTGADWKFVSSGDVAVPKECLGKGSVHFAFKYTCSDASSGTWEINDAVLKK